jgi:hypothetical protein
MCLPSSQAVSTVVTKNYSSEEGKEMEEEKIETEKKERNRERKRETTIIKGFKCQ